MVKEWDFRRRKLLGKYIIKMLYKWNNKKFEDNIFFREETLKGGNVRVKDNKLSFSLLFSVLFIFLVSDWDLVKR